MRKSIVLVTLTVLALLAVSGSFPLASSAKPPYKLMCNPDSFGLGSGMYAYTGTSAFTEDIAGYVEFCSQGSLTVIAGPPSIATSANYNAMGGITTSVGLVLVLAQSDGHFWFCIGATPMGCSIESTLITLPSSFCSTTFAGACNPMGVTLDPKLNIYYADPANGFVYECTAASQYQSCTIPGWGLLPGLNHHYVTGIFRASNGTFYMSDGDSDPSCLGNVWKGVPGTGSVTLWTPPFGGGWNSIVLSNANPSKKLHIYVGGDGCAGGIASIYDVTDSIASSGYVVLKSPFTSGDSVYGLTTKLQFLAYGSSAYSLKDTS